MKGSQIPDAVVLGRSNVSLASGKSPFLACSDAMIQYKILMVI